MERATSVGRRGGGLGREAALRHAGLVLPPLVLLFLLVACVAHHQFAVDFSREYWVAGRRMLEGRDLYAWSLAQVRAGVSFPYPAVAALVMTPFGLLPRGVSAAIFVLLSLAATAAALRVLAVRDWRVYSLCFLLWPVINALQAANLTLVLALLIALVWRYRERPLAAGLLTALAISLKPFVWPLGLWLIATKRARASGWAVIGLAVANAVAWPIVGLGEIHEYLALDHLVTRTLDHSGYSLVAIALRMGATQTVALGVLGAVSVALALVCLRLGARRRDDAALTVAVALMLAASPLVWNHYPALLIVPVAIRRPRLGPDWLAMLPLWFCPAMHVREWQALLAVLVTGALTTGLVAPPSRQMWSPRRSRLRRHILRGRGGAPEPGDADGLSSPGGRPRRDRPAGRDDGRAARALHRAS